jgi:hypothetical protein
MMVVPADTPPPQRAGNALFSPDGFTWTPYDHNPITAGGYGEVWAPHDDPVRKIYGLLHRWNMPFRGQDAEGNIHNNTIHDPSVARLIA